tara:strand:- start:521 stop:1054 length:534 start_codon:yes stop_codon:yes gene_type:complete
MRIGVMCSGNGSNFENIVHSCPEHDVVLMIYNKENCGAKERAIRLGIPHCHLKSTEESEITRRFTEANVDLIVLAGWMRVLSSEFINSFPDKIINIHPSLLPKYKGLNVIERAMESGEVVTGCTVHYVNEELDSGDIIDQSTVQIYPDDTIELLTQRVHQAEYRLLPSVINQVLDKF